MTLICTIYRSPKQEGMYLYVEKDEDVARVPEVLLKTFGEPEEVMVLAFTPERKLARVDRAEVEQSIKDQGFFLQMPPGNADYMQKPKVKPDQ